MTKARDLGDVVSNIAWTTYTPTFTISGGTFTIGNGTITAKYKQIGKIVFAHINILFGSTTSISGTDLEISLPVNASPGYPVPIGTGNILDSGTTVRPAFIGMTQFNTKFWVRAMLVNSTYAAEGLITSTVPQTWATNDAIAINLTYEAA